MQIPARFFTAPLLFAAVALLISAARGRAAVPENMTPVLLAVQDAPVPFLSSDGRTHLVYELEMTNFSSADVTVEKVEVLGDGAPLQILDAAAVAKRLQPGGMRESTGTLAKSTHALLFLNVVLAPGPRIPHQLSHRVAMRVSAAPAGHQELSENGGAVAVDRRPVVVIGPPLHGERYISADSCCDAVRHTRAALPVNGRVWVSQRYAIDWEQLNASGRIYTGPRRDLKSYAIFGQPALAVGIRGCRIRHRRAAGADAWEIPRRHRARCSRWKLHHPRSWTAALRTLRTSPAREHQGSPRRKSRTRPSARAGRRFRQLDCAAPSLPGDGQAVVSRVQWASLRDRQLSDLRQNSRHCGI